MEEEVVLGVLEVEGGRRGAGADLVVGEVHQEEEVDLVGVEEDRHGVVGHRGEEVIEWFQVMAGIYVDIRVKSGVQEMYLDNVMKTESCYWMVWGS